MDQTQWVVEIGKTDGKAYLLRTDEGGENYLLHIGDWREIRFYAEDDAKAIFHANSIINERYQWAMR